MDTIVPLIPELEKRVDIAMDNSDVELEAIIDTKMVNRSTFIAVKNSLSKEVTIKPLFNGQPQITLDISTKFVSLDKNTGKEYINSSFERATIKGKDNVQRYCRSGKLPDDPDSVEYIKKNSARDTSAQGKPIYFKPWPPKPNYKDKKKGKDPDTPYFKYRINMKTETELTDRKLNNFIHRIKKNLKSYRYKCRWSYISLNNQFRIDCTVVKSTKYGDFFDDFKASGVLNRPEEYEIEIEYIGNKDDLYEPFTLDEDTLNNPSFDPGSPDYSPPQLSRSYSSVISLDNISSSNSVSPDNTDYVEDMVELILNRKDTLPEKYTYIYDADDEQQQEVALRLQDEGINVKVKSEKASSVLALPSKQKTFMLDLKWRQEMDKLEGLTIADKFGRLEDGKMLEWPEANRCPGCKQDFGDGPEGELNAWIHRWSDKSIYINDCVPKIFEERHGIDIIALRDRLKIERENREKDSSDIDFVPDSEEEIAAAEERDNIKEQIEEINTKVQEEIYKLGEWPLSYRKLSSRGMKFISDQDDKRYETNEEFIAYLEGDSGKGEEKKRDYEQIRDLEKNNAERLKVYETIDNFKQEITELHTALKYQKKIVNYKPGQEKKELVKLVLITLDTVLKKILRVVYNTHYIISEQKRSDIHQGYRKVTGQQDSKYTNFIGPNPVSMDMKHIISNDGPNIYDNDYVVTEKADGDRYLLFIHSDSNGYLYNNGHRTNEIINTGIKFPDEYHGWILDGEYITTLVDGTPTKLFYIFDIYYHTEDYSRVETHMRPWKSLSDDYPGRKYFIDSFMEYINIEPESHAEGWVDNNRIKILKKNYYYTSKNAFISAQRKLNEIENDRYPYKTDGLIFLPYTFAVGLMDSKKTKQTNLNGGAWFANFKWKPSNLNTIDFAVSIDPDIKVMPDPENPNKLKYYNTVDLMVNYSEMKDDSIDFFNKMIMEPTTFPDKRNKTKIFNPEKKQEFTRNKRLRTQVKENSFVYIERIQKEIEEFEKELNKLEKEEGDRDVKKEKELSGKIKDRKEEIEDYNVFSKAVEKIGKANLFLEKNRIVCLEDKEEVKGDTIVEFAFDRTKRAGFQWIPLRLRKDKGFPQASATAENVWKTINDPITDLRISEKPTEKEMKQLQDKYLDIKEGQYYKTINRDSSVTKPLVDFHNYIKRNLIIGACSLASKMQKRDISVLDLAIGRGGDINKYINEEAHVSKLFGIDIDKPGIVETCTERWWRKSKFQRRDILGLFIYGDSSVNIKSGLIAADDPKILDILKNIYTYNQGAPRTIAGEFHGFASSNDREGGPERLIDYMGSNKNPNEEVLGEINEHIDKVIVNEPLTDQKSEELKNRGLKRRELELRKDMIMAGPEMDVVSAQFAFHYFFESVSKLESVLLNVSQNLRNGGYFIGTCFDANKVLQLFGNEEVDIIEHKDEDDDLIYSLRKGENFPLPEDFEWDEGQDVDPENQKEEMNMCGRPLHVKMEAFGSEQKEYLVNYNYFIAKCKQYQLYPLNMARDQWSESLDKSELEHFMSISLGHFDDVYDSYLKSENIQEGEGLDDTLKQISFLNRWFVFKKVGPPEKKTRNQLERDIEEMLEKEAPKHRIDITGASGDYGDLINGHYYEIKKDNQDYIIYLRVKKIESEPTTYLYREESTKEEEDSKEWWIGNVYNMEHQEAKGYAKTEITGTKTVPVGEITWSVLNSDGMESQQFTIEEQEDPKSPKFSPPSE